MSGRGNAHSSATGPSSSPRPEGIYMSTEQILELVRSTQPPAPAPTPPPHQSVFARYCSDFTHLGGKPFLGSESVLDVQAWLRTCERIFSHMEISDHH